MIVSGEIAWDKDFHLSSKWLLLNLHSSIKISTKPNSTHCLFPFGNRQLQSRVMQQLYRLQQWLENPLRYQSSSWCKLYCHCKTISCTSIPILTTSLPIDSLSKGIRKLYFWFRGICSSSSNVFGSKMPTQLSTERSVQFDALGASVNLSPNKIPLCIGNSAF